jgi:hypothetical protein
MTYLPITIVKYVDSECPIFGHCVRRVWSRAFEGQTTNRPTSSRVPPQPTNRRTIRAR